VGGAPAGRLFRATRPGTGGNMHARPGFVKPFVARKRPFRVSEGAAAREDRRPYLPRLRGRCVRCGT
jgi:hypothetical protein